MKKLVFSVFITLLLIFISLPGPVLGVDGNNGGTLLDPNKRTTGLLEFVTEDGKLLDDVEALSVDEMLKVFLPVNTICHNSAGQLLPFIIVETQVKLPGGMPDTGLIGEVYKLGPEGAVFKPSIKLIFRYDTKNMPEWAKEENLTIVWWDDKAGAWVELASQVDTVKNTVTADITHFSFYSLMLKTTLAEFKISEISVSRADLITGDTVNVSALVTNKGDLPGEYSMALAVNGKKLGEKSAVIKGGDTADFTFELAFRKSGAYTIGLNGVERTLTVLPSPAAFNVDGLTIVPLNGRAGEDIRISFTIFNNGESEGNYPVTCMLDGAAWEKMDVHLAGESNKDVTFTLKQAAAGTHTVAVNDILAADFLIEAAPPPTARPASLVSETPVVPLETPDVGQESQTQGIDIMMLVVAGVLFVIAVVVMLLIYNARKKHIR